MEALGPEITRAFMRGFRCGGDYTAEKQAQPDATAESVEAYGRELMRLDAERRTGMGSL